MKKFLVLLCVFVLFCGSALAIDVRVGNTQYIARVFFDGVPEQTVQIKAKVDGMEDYTFNLTPPHLEEVLPFGLHWGEETKLTLEPSAIAGAEVKVLAPQRKDENGTLELALWVEPKTSPYVPTPQANTNPRVVRVVLDGKEVASKPLNIEKFENLTTAQEVDFGEIALPPMVAFAEVEYISDNGMNFSTDLGTSYTLNLITQDDRIVIQVPKMDEANSPSGQLFNPVFRVNPGTVNFYYDVHYTKPQPTASPTPTQATTPTPTPEPMATPTLAATATPSSTPSAPSLRTTPQPSLKPAVPLKPLPKTGDTENALLYIGLILAAVLGAVLVFKKKKK